MDNTDLLFKQSLSCAILEDKPKSEEAASATESVQNKTKKSNPRPKPKRSYGPQIRTQLASSNNQDVRPNDWPIPWRMFLENPHTWGFLGAVNEGILKSIWIKECEKARARGCDVYEENIDHGYNCNSYGCNCTDARLKKKESKEEQKKERKGLSRPKEKAN